MPRLQEPKRDEAFTLARKQQPFNNELYPRPIARA